jgi:manganese/zinc/iron transport system substrate-binding protein
MFMRMVRTAGAVFLAIMMIGCGTLARPAQSDLSLRKLRVTTTVGMLTDIIKNVGGDRVEVTGLMGPGVDPHLYKPSTGDVFKLDRADIIFYVGLHLEGRMAELFEKMVEAGKPTFAVSEEIDRSRLRKVAEFEGSYDPHIWFDVTLWKEAVRKVAKELSNLDPESRASYERNAEAYLAQLDELDAYVAARIAEIPEPSRVLITAHDAFGYFGGRYGVEVRGLQGTSTATEAGARNVQELARLIVERKIKAIFVESSVPRATIEAVQAAVQARGWNVEIGGELFSDAMGDEGTPEGTYIGMVRHNVDTIVQALR